MTSEQWEKAPEVDAVEARPCDHKFVDSKHCLKCGWEPPQRRTDPAPPSWDEVTEVSCIICGVKDGEHDPACPRQKAIAP